MPRPVRDPLPSDTPWVFRRITPRTNAYGRQGRLRGAASRRVASPQASGSRPRSTADRWSR
jgi:hypothetical protein